MCTKKSESNPDTVPSLVMDEPVNGALRAHGGRALLAVELVAGRTYTIRIPDGAARGHGRPTPSHLAIHDDAGTWLAGTTNAERTDSGDCSLTFAATRDGIYYVDAGTDDRTPSTIEFNDVDTVASRSTKKRQVDDARASAVRDSATDLGDITGLDASRFPVTHVHGNGEPVVLFRFMLTQSRRVSFGLRRLETPARLVLENAHGAMICARSHAAPAGGWLSAALSAGTYFARVQVPETGHHPFALRYCAGSEFQDAMRDIQPRYATQRGRAVQAAPAFGAYSPSKRVNRSRPRISLGSVARADSGGLPLWYRLVGGNEAGLFELDAHTGELFFTGTDPSLKIWTGELELTVRASDGERSVHHAVFVSVTNVPDTSTSASVFDAVAEAFIPAGGDARISLGRVSESGPDEPPLKYRLVGGNETGLFALDEASGELFFTGSVDDFERLGTGFELTVRVDAESH